jgi:hypothetical protein
MLSALIALFAQSLSAEMVKYERLDEVIPTNLSSPFQSLYRGGNGDVGKEGFQVVCG